MPINNILKSMFSLLKSRIQHKNSLDTLRLRSTNYHEKQPYSFIDDQYFIAYYFQKRMCYPINFKHPETFNEKLNWIKLYDRKAVYTQISDKWQCRDYVSQKIGTRYVKPLLSVCDSVEDINWQDLPEKFVIKVTHGSGWNIICNDITQFNRPEAEAKLMFWLTQNFYQKFREWQYKSAKPRIIVEPYLEGDPILGLVEYQFYCFGGKPEFIQVDIDCNRAHTRLFLSPDWQEMPFRIVRFPKFEGQFPRPEKLDEALLLVSKLTKDLPFCRVDLHILETDIFISEMTLMPAGGFMKFDPPEYDRIIGDLLDINPKKSILPFYWRIRDNQ